MICETCTDLFRTLSKVQVKDKLPEGSELKGRFEHHATYNAFKRALDIGCVFCKKVWAQIRDEVLDMDDDKLAAFRLEFEWSLYLQSNSLGSFSISTAKELEWRFWICLWPVYSSQDRLLLPGYHETTNTGSDACFILANHWLKTCLSSHRNCERLRPPSLEEWTPSRLIRIRSTDDLVLCLRNMGNIPTGVEYATLSHCWGNIPETQRLVLTSENISSWTRRIPDLKSMKTFDQAIVSCQKLGLEYIWIDSLCILQDCQDDWRKEASLMSTVYKYSKCTITATAAIDDTVGCFFDRDSDICLPTRVEFFRNQICFLGSSKQSIPNFNPLPEDSSPTLLLGYYDIEDIVDWDGGIELAPVNQRSWVVQERLLSPRVIHFSDRQLFWECAELQASESSPFGIPGGEITKFKTLSPYQNQDQYLIDLDLETETQSQERQRLASAFRIWKSTLSAYTRGKLSKGSDKLIAISAIARELQPLMRCRYLAGLWEASLVLQLAWWSDKTVIPSMGYRAPSWSWASIDGEVHLTGPEISDSVDPLVETLEVVIDLVGEDEFGQVQGGHLTLLGQTIDLEVLDYDEESELHNVTFNGKPTFATIFENSANMRTEISTNQICCVPLYLRLRGEMLFLRGLILECVDVTKNEYRRVGLLMVHSRLIPVEINHSEKYSIENPFLSTLGNFEQTKDGSPVFKRESRNFREITIV